MDKQQEIEKRAIRRQHRILKRGLDRGEIPPEEVAAYEKQHADILGIVPKPAEEPMGTPFVSPDGRDVELRNLYRGWPVFIVLSGPSIKKLDLSLLNNRGIISFGVNNSPTMVRTNLWTYVDRANKFHDGIWLDPAVMKFVPDRHFNKQIRTQLPDGTVIPLVRESGGKSEPMLVGQCPGVVGYRRCPVFDPAVWLPEPTINWGNSLKAARYNKKPRILNTMFAVLKIAYWLGFRVVYLLGCDFHMSPDQPYGFNQSKSIEGVNGNNSSYATLHGMLDQLKPHFDAAGFHVFNCNRESGLTTFPHVNYRDAINSVRKMVPQDPLNASGWYE